VRSWYDHQYPLSQEVTMPSRDRTPFLLSDSKDIAPQPVIGSINLTPCINYICTQLLLTVVNIGVHPSRAVSIAFNRFQCVLVSSRHR
jgi:hypothetical protein